MIPTGHVIEGVAVRKPRVCGDDPDTEAAEAGGWS